MRKKLKIFGRILRKTVANPVVKIVIGLVGRPLGMVDGLYGLGWLFSSTSPVGPAVFFILSIAAWCLGIICAYILLLTPDDIPMWAAICSMSGPALWILKQLGRLLWKVIQTATSSMKKVVQESAQEIEQEECLGQQPNQGLVLVTDQLEHVLLHPAGLKLRLDEEKEQSIQPRS